MAIAERLGRPYRVLVNNDLLRIPEMRSKALPIDFSPTREAMATNLKTRAEARRFLKEGTTIVIFPAGGVATAENPFGKAEDLPWKLFAARLVEQSDASVMPVFFEGQNSALFHYVSRYSLTLRLSLLVCEFRYGIGPAHQGPCRQASLLRRTQGRRRRRQSARRTVLSGSSAGPRRGRAVSRTAASTSVGSPPPLPVGSSWFGVARRRQARGGGLGRKVGLAAKRSVSQWINCLP